MRVQIESIPPSVADQRDTPLFGQFNRKGGGGGARDQDARSQSHGFLQHLRTDASRGDEDASLRPDVLHETHPRDFVERVVASDVFGGEQDALAVGQRGGVDSASLAVQILRLEQHLDQVTDSAGGEDEAVRGRAPPRSRDGFDGGHPARTAGGARPLGRLVHCVVQPNVHVIAVLADADIGYFIHRIYHAFIEEEADRHCFEQDGRAHERNPGLAVDRERDGRLDDGAAVGGFVAGGVDLEILDGLAGFEHGSPTDNWDD